MWRGDKDWKNHILVLQQIILNIKLSEIMVIYWILFIILMRLTQVEPVKGLHQWTLMKNDCQDNKSDHH